MATFFLAPYPTFGTAKNRKSEAFQKKSPYYWWWAYLKRNQDYLECCANGGEGRLAHLYKDFGDVRDKEFESTARYKLSRNYTTANLENALDVYDLWLANESKPKAERMKQWELGVKLNLNKLAAKDAKSDLKQDRAVGRNLLGATVKRYLTQAQKTIKSLEQGVFPVIK